MRRYKTKRKSNRDFFINCFLIVALIVVAIIINISLRPVVYDISSQIGKQNVASLINETVFEVLESDSFDYSSFVDLKYNTSGFVTSVEYDYAFTE